VVGDGDAVVVVMGVMPEDVDITEDVYITDVDITEDVAITEDVYITDVDITADEVAAIEVLMEDEVPIIVVVIDGVEVGIVAFPSVNENTKYCQITF